MGIESWSHDPLVNTLLIRPLAISLMSRVFDNGLGDWGSILGRVIPKTQKMVLGVALFNT